MRRTIEILTITQLRKGIWGRGARFFFFTAKLITGYGMSFNGYSNRFKVTRRHFAFQLLLQLNASNWFVIAAQESSDEMVCCFCYFRGRDTSRRRFRVRFRRLKANKNKKKKCPKPCTRHPGFTESSRARSSDVRGRDLVLVLAVSRRRKPQVHCVYAPPPRAYVTAFCDHDGDDDAADHCCRRGH